MKASSLTLLQLLSLIGLRHGHPPLSWSWVNPFNWSNPFTHDKLKQETESLMDWIGEAGMNALDHSSLPESVRHVGEYLFAMFSCINQSNRRQPSS